MPTRRELQWMRMTHQQRSRETLERILTATEQLLEDREFDRLTVAEIVQQSESSVGAFYARIRDKEALLHLIHERFFSEAQATIDDALDPHRWVDANAGEIITALTAFMARIYRERAGLLRAFILHGCGSNPQFDERDRRMSQHLFDRLHVLMAERRQEFTHPHLPTGLAFGMRMVAALLVNVYVMGRGREDLMGLSQGQLAHELSRAYHGYLGLPFDESARDDAPPPTPVAASGGEVR